MRCSVLAWSSLLAPGYGVAVGALGGPHGPGGVCRSASRSRETLLHEGRAAGGRHSGASGGWAEGLQEVTALAYSHRHTWTLSLQTVGTETGDRAA